MFLRKLSEASGVSGSENEVRDLIREEIGDKVDDIRTDTIGNMVATKKGRKERPTVMIAAHMDEVGLMISHIEKDGMLYFEKVGGIDDRLLISKTVLIGKDKKPGVIGSKPIHLMEEEEREKVIRYDNLYIDIGAKNKEEAEGAVKIGEVAVFATEFDKIGDLYKGKAFDDRVGCAILTDVLKEDLPLTVKGAFTVQEEVGLRGATVVAYDLDPDIALVLEGTSAGDTPDNKEYNISSAIGRGPVITIIDPSIVCDKRLVDLLIKTAEENDIPYQFKSRVSGGTDAGRIHLTKEGIPSAVVAAPCRYIHSPAALMSEEDFNNLKRLVRCFLTKVAEEWRTES